MLHSETSNISLPCVLTPLPPNRVVAIQPCTVDVILEVYSHSGYIQRQRKSGRSNGGMRTLLPLRTWYVFLFFSSSETDAAS